MKIELSNTRENKKIIKCSCYNYDSEKDLEEAYLSGLKADRLKWHYLRKNPKYLPNGHRTIFNQSGKITNYDPNRGFLGLDGIGVIAWCEIQKYEGRVWISLKENGNVNLRNG